MATTSYIKKTHQLLNARALGLVSSAVLLTSFAVTPSNVSASSFQILEQSPAHLGKAFAGTASDVIDGSGVFFNPASLAAWDSPVLTLAGNAIFTESQFRNTNSNTNGVPGKTDEVGFVPNLYYVHPLNERITLGLGVNAPFGLASDYDEDWQGRYLATHSDLEVINLSAVAGIQLTDLVSLGLGLSYQRAEVTLESQFDSTLGVAPSPATDSHARITGDDDALAADVSLFYVPTDRLQLGLIWRQGAHFDLTGDARFTLNPACSPNAGYPTGEPPAPTTGTLCAASLTAVAGDAKARVELPDTLTLSGTYRLTDHWSLHGDVAWTEWSSIHTIDVINRGNDLPITTLELHYQNTMRYALGFSHESDCPWSWRFGIALDESPQTDPTLLNPRIPDQDRIWFSAGFNYEFSANTSLDVGYTYIKVDKASINNTHPQTGHHVEGTFDADVNILGAQANWRF